MRAKSQKGRFIQQINEGIAQIRQSIDIAIESTQLFDDIYEEINPALEKYKKTLYALVEECFATYWAGEMEKPDIIKVINDALKDIKNVNDNVDQLFHIVREEENEDGPNDAYKDQ